MVRAIWSGSLSFGLVNVPVKVVTATKPQDVKFHMLHEADGGRIQQKRVCSVDGEEVPYENIAKGYKVGPDQYVMVTPEELDAVASEKSDTIDISDFVDIGEIDPIYFEKPYYLIPQKGAAKAYGLLVEAMRRAGKVAIARVVMRTKEHLVAVRPLEDVLVMETLLYHDEIVRRDQLEEAPAKVAAPAEKELDMAQKLIEALTTEFDPEKYQDTHRAKVLELIEAKAEGRTVTAPPREERAAPGDLVAALKASLEAAKAKARQPSDEAEA